MFAFDEFKFMKKVNPNLTKRTMNKISFAVNDSLYIVSDVFSKKDIFVLIANESTFKQYAILDDIGGTNKGLMQVQKNTYEQVCRNNKDIPYEWDRINNIRYNVLIGLIILKSKIQNVKKFKPKDNMELKHLSLIAYNKGEYRLKNDIKDGRRDYHNFKYIRSLARFYKLI